MRIFSYLVLLTIMLIGLTFASLNSTIVSFNYYIGTRDIALSLLLVFSFGAGICLGLLAAIFPWLRAKTEVFRMKSRLKIVEKEVENLRSIPIKDDQ
jgi:lipopolysaccharide assembly protein A